MPKEKLDFVLSILFVSIFVLLLMTGLFMLFRIYLKRKNKLLLERERMSIQFEQTLLQSKLEIQEQTFHDISQELHDNIGQLLSLVSIHLNTLEPGHQAEKLTLMDELLSKAITDCRNLSHSLDADFIRNKGWTEPVQKLLHNLQNTGKFMTTIRMDEELPSLGNEKPIILFRMIQEIIQNIIKHAEANTINLNAKKENGRLIIAIQDNGKGFSDKAAGEGAGLRNLEKRAKMIDADLAINSRPGAGTLVTISVKTTDNLG